MRFILLALPITFVMTLALLPSSSVSAADEEYWCYGDNVSLEYEGEAETVRWRVNLPCGQMLQEEEGSLLSIDASKYEELLVTQTVGTDRGSSTQTVRIHPLHKNYLNLTVNFFDEDKLHSSRVIDSTTVCRNNVFLELPENPIREGKKFGGWLNENDSPFATEEPITEDLNVHAKWLNSCSVVLISRGLVQSSFIAFEEDRLDLPEMESEDGCEFRGWSTDGNFFVEFDPDQPITGDMVLYASWSEGQHPLNHSDKASIAVLLPVLALLSILVYARIHRNRIRVMSGTYRHR